MLARASWPHSLFSVFTCPTQRVLISRWTPARAPRPDNLTFQTCCSTRLTRPTRRFWNQSDVGESLRDKQPYLFKPTARPGLPVRHGDSETSRTSARASGTDNFPFPSCGRQGLPNLQTALTARPSDPLNFAFLSKPVRLGEPRSPDGRRREHSRPDNLIFSSPRSTRLTRPTWRFWNHSQTSARASQPDNLTFPSPELGKVYPSDTAIAEATVGRRREPPSQTILPFKVPCSAKLTRPARQLLKPPSDVGESFPARQLILSVCSHHDIELRRTLRARPFRQS